MAEYVQRPITSPLRGGAITLPPNTSELIREEVGKATSETVKETKDELKKVTSQLSNLATKQEIQQLSLTFKESYPTLSALKTTYPNGDNANHTVLADNMIYTYKNEWVSTGIQANGTGIANKSVTIEKTDFIRKSSNLFNKDTVKTGGYINHTGTLVTSTTWVHSDFIPVEKGKTYTSRDGLSNIGCILYNQNKEFIEAIWIDATPPITSGQKRTFTITNANAKYMIVNVTIEKINTNQMMVVEGSTLPAEFVPHDSLFINDKEIADKTFVQRKISESGLSNPLKGTNLLLNYSESSVEGVQNYNTAVGVEALAIAGDTKYATAIGYQALKNNKPDGTPDSGLYNTAVGYQALTSNITGDHNTAVGFCALRDNKADFNTACGEDSLLFNTTGDSNAGLGVYSLKNNTTGRGNSAVGVNALANNTTGNWNTAIGENAGVQTFTGVGNCDLDTGMTFIGAMASVDKSVNKGPFENATAIGRSAKVNKSNMVRLGNSTVTVVETYGDYETLTTGKGIVLKSPNGTRHRIMVTDAGVVSATAI